MKRFSLISAFGLVVLFAVAPTLADPDIEVLPTSHDFGSVWLCDSATTVITIFNVGGHPLLVNAIDFQAGSSEYFAITAGPALPVSIPAVNGKPNWLDIEVTYSPSGVGVHSAVLEIVSNDPDDSVVQIALTGTGVSPLEICPLAYDFGDVEVGTCSPCFFLAIPTIPAIQRISRVCEYGARFLPQGWQKNWQGCFGVERLKER